jgi:hypothetical protein
MRLSIGGLEVRPGVWRKAFDEGGYDSDAGEDREAGVALGYVAQVWNACLRVCACVQGGLGGRGALPVQHWSAHAALPLGCAVTVTPLLLLPPCCCCPPAAAAPLQVVHRLAAYLAVPLRYPLALRGSRSAVIDNYPPAGTW